ncbi:PREDICTED: LOC110745087 [Prunus dulcis]|uniref:PREDICTED: LOC110745087 n=1 Tax=Prunus dulcis TaxID=3755 RepID=A0A5E4F9E7_PRUDU|nr:PREDICTED: LOC110745087 [Prunus dulcis]
MEEPNFQVSFCVLAVRDDEGDKEVVEEMYEAAEQMGEDMPIGLRGSFEYRGARDRIRFEEAKARGSAALISLFARVDESARCSPSLDESKRVQDHGKCPSIVAASTQVRPDQKSDVARLSVEEEFVPVELDLVELSATEQEQVNQVLALPSTERATDRLLASEGLISSAGELL